MKTRHIVIGFSILAFAAAASGQAPDTGIAVTNPVVIAKCGACHARDERGIMQRISFGRTTPEGWQAVVKDMILTRDVSLTPEEARAIVKYLSTANGLAPDEARPVAYEVERRVHDETGLTDTLKRSCGRCHNFARALSWRRSVGEWKQFLDSHSATYRVKPNEAAEALAILTHDAPLHTSAWDAWIARGAAPNVAGRWLLTASMPGRGDFYGDMQVDRTGDDEFATHIRMTSVRDGSTVNRTGKIAVYGGSAWRGRSSGIAQPTANQAFANLASATPDDPAGDAREVLLFDADSMSAGGRWFWGHYDEFGLDVHLTRAGAGPSLLLTDRASLKIGTRGNRIRILGENLPSSVAAADLTMGAGVTVEKVVSNTPSEIVAEVAVASSAQPGRRDVALRGARSSLAVALAIYDRVDYLKVTPESAVASFGDPKHPRGYQQFEAIGYQRGPDGRVHTDDDLPLGPFEVSWTVKVFHTGENETSDFAGTMTPTGLLTPAAVNPNNNFDAWVNAVSSTEKDAAGGPLTGKAYVVIAIPTYAINGRQYVRDLDRWVDDGPAAPGVGQNGKPPSAGRGGGRGGGPVPGSGRSGGPVQ